MDKDIRTIELTWNERRLIERVLSEHPYNVLGKAIIYYGRTVESILDKLDEREKDNVNSSQT